MADAGEPAAGSNVIEHDLRAVRYLRGVLSDDWDRAADAAGDLADEIRQLPWTERAGMIDAFIWAQARDRLTKEEVTAIVNRQRVSITDPTRVDGYALFCRAVVSATLHLLEDTAKIEHEAAALVHFFSLEPGHRELALDWIGDGHHNRLAEGLPAWPGCAFLLLILSPSDSAESFLARDAFWAAMLGRP